MRKIFLAVLFVMLMASAVYADKATFSIIGQGSKAVTTPGTALQLSSTSQGCGVLYITATHEISHDITSVYIGTSGVSAGGAWGNKQAKAGIPVLSNDVTVLPVSDVSMVWVDAAHSQDGVTWLFLN